MAASLPPILSLRSSCLRAGWFLTTLMIGCGRAADPLAAKDVRCPEPQGEFPPTDCAVVVGTARDSSGRPLTFPAIRVDSAIPRGAYLYASSTVHPSPDGSFEIVVLRVSRLLPPGIPDTATVELKAFTQANPKAGDRPAAAAPVLMRFSPLGEVVRPSVAAAVFAQRRPAPISLTPPPP